MAPMAVTKQINRMLLAALLLCAQNIYAGPGLPDFGLHTLDGKAHSISDEIGRGQWVLLMFWATDCGICRQQEPMISSFHKNHSSNDARVIGISIDGLEKKQEVRRFLANNELSYPNYIGNLALIGLNYPVLTEEAFRGTPTYLLFSPQGELLGVNPGPMRLEALEAFIKRYSQG